MVLADIRSNSPINFNLQCTPESADDLERYFYMADEQGSTLFITDGAQDIKNEYFYDAFGNVLDSREEVHNRITYVGQQFDSVSQQYYLRARFYSPVIGRFTQEDVYRGDGLNLYAYCRDNPVMYYDPSGYKLCAENKNRLFEEYKGYRDKGYTPQQAYDEMKAARNGKINSKTRLPRNNGKWEGDIGESKWYSDKEAVKNITKGEGVEFINGRPNFTPWSKGKIKFKDGVLNGSKSDFDSVYEKIKDLKGLKSKNQAKEWLKSKGLTPHHKSSKEIELIPTDLHKNVPHIGSASDMRGGF